MDNPEFVLFLLLNNVLWFEGTAHCLHFYLLNRMNLESFNISYLIFQIGKRTFLLALVKFLHLFENLKCLFFCNLTSFSSTVCLLSYHMHINKQCSGGGTSFRVTG